MAFSPLILQLIQAFRCLPGVGPKSAQRMTFQLLTRQRDNARLLANVLLEAAEQVGHCTQCRILCETELCSICTNPKRDASQLCIVENPADLLAVEQTNSYRGLYFVLLGHLSPLDGIGPKDIGIEELQHYLNTHPVEEIIIATNPTVEGEATANYIAQLVNSTHIRCTRIAHGVPMGGELEYLDAGTLARALISRVDLETEAA